MITPDQLDSWRRLAACDALAGAPLGDALREACDEIESLQIATDREMAHDSNHINDALQKLVEAEADRDRARDAAVALEQESARLTAKLDQPCGSCHPCTNYANETWREAGRKPPHVHEWDELRGAEKRARELHRPIVKTLDDDEATKVTVCLGCDAVRESCSDEGDPVLWPCATILALDGGES